MNTTLQQLRQQHGYSMVEVASKTGIPVRQIAAAEHGVQSLDPQQLAQLSALYNVATKQLVGRTVSRVSTPFLWIMGVGLIFLLAAGAVVLGGTMMVMSMPATRTMIESRVIPQVAQSPIGASAQLRQRLLQMALTPNSAQQAMMDTESADTPSEGATVVLLNVEPLAAIASKRGLPGAPFGCPVKPADGAVVMTQGYAVGTHAPAAIWGAVDLAVDSNGDGYADPSATLGAPIVALHSGIARVVPNNWLAGNYVKITDEVNGWATAYAHLNELNIVSGQRVEPGMIIGWVGTTGYSSGPHLHYEVYQNDININPLSILECW
jgi:murein DD-endopeptidase MepM/ murein hydrolase activator NlpD